jgi:hypothetical protein
MWWRGGKNWLLTKGESPGFFIYVPFIHPRFYIFKNKNENENWTPYRFVANAS